MNSVIPGHQISPYRSP
ncbi:hypothetical protein Zm00014a_026242 [Zea mays]|uniref:Uncharacterized protein n=1 Tax=Zea mays TaxID=4577 RepID=A0A3L6E6W5_MAIZE|nr:hypothetical protein Zm00014a_026242 [Zea mays]